MRIRVAALLFASLFALTSAACGNRKPQPQASSSAAQEAEEASSAASEAAEGPETAAKSETADTSSAQEDCGPVLTYSENKVIPDYYHYENKQWAYKDIDRCIFVEQYMEDSEVHELRDYKFFCFNGKVKCFKIDYNRHTNHQANYYDAHGKMLSIIEELCPPNIEKNIEVPDNIEEMIKMSEKLAKLVNNPFVRIDFYNVNGYIYFGEFTFYPDGGFGHFKPEEWDYTLGSWIDLSPLKIK